MINITVIGTNAYALLALRFIRRWMHFYGGVMDAPEFNHRVTFHLFSDVDPYEHLDVTRGQVVWRQTQHRSWLEADHAKIETVGRVAEAGEAYTYYFDADTNIQRRFTSQWFVGELVAGQHYCDVRHKPFDRNPDSHCCVPSDAPGQVYCYGAFFGGTSARVAEMCRELVQRERADREGGYEAAVNDESYLNWYWHHNKPTLVVPCHEFPFSVSDKGGLAIERRPEFAIHEQLAALRARRGDLFDIKRGRVVFS